MEPICQLRSPCPDKIVSNFTFHTLWESKGDPKISANAQSSVWLPLDLNSHFSWISSACRFSCHSGPAVYPGGSKWETQLLPPSPQSLYYIIPRYLCSQRFHSKWDMKHGREEDVSITATQAKMGAVLILKVSEHLSLGTFFFVPSP